MDKIYFNAKIYSLDEKDTLYSAIGIKNGKIAFLGNDEEAKAIKTAKAVDLKGAFVLPGFIDSHLHVLGYAFAENSYNMFDSDSIDSIIQQGKRRISDMSETDEKQWLFGRGWNEQNFFDEKRTLTRQDLDKISTVRPILFIRVCGHAAAVNTKGLETVMNLPQTKEYISQIDFERGILKENSISLCYNAIKAPSTEEIKQMIIFAQKRLNSRGITSVESDNFLSLPGRVSRKSIIEAHRQLDEENKLTVRIREQASFTAFEDMKSFIDEGYRTGQGSDFYSIGPVKLYQDGSLGAKTALLYEPYSNSGGYSGVMVHTAKNLQRFVDYAYKHDMQILIHSIGDKSSDMACTAYEKAIKKYGQKDSRLAINHLQVVSHNLFDRMKNNNILAYIQPAFVAGDKAVIRERIGEKREKRSYAWKTMIKKGICCCAGSDAPVEDFDVLCAIQIAVTRDRLDEISDGWYPDEKLTVKEAVKLFTVNNSYGSFSENKKGSLELGKLADMVVLNDDIFKADSHSIAKIQINRTIVGGVEV